MSARYRSDGRSARLFARESRSACRTRSKSRSNTNRTCSGGTLEGPQTRAKFQPRFGRSSIAKFFLPRIEPQCFFVRQFTRRLASSASASARSCTFRSQARRAKQAFSIADGRESLACGNAVCSSSCSTRLARRAGSPRRPWKEVPPKVARRSVPARVRKFVSRAAPAPSRRVLENLRGRPPVARSPLQGDQSEGRAQVPRGVHEHAAVPDLCRHAAQGGKPVRPLQRQVGLRSHLDVDQTGAASRRAEAEPQESRDRAAHPERDSQAAQFLAESA